MATKLKDHYDAGYTHGLADKITAVETGFDQQEFLQRVLPTLKTLEFGARQELLAEALAQTVPGSYEQQLATFTKILGPELPGILGMFTDGWWLWPVGRFVEKHGTQNYEASLEFCRELTKRFTGKYAMRPLLEYRPGETMRRMVEWSVDDNQRICRLASECVRPRLPWAKKSLVCLDFVDEYRQLLGNLKDDSDRTIQKSVANNLNDLYKDAEWLFTELVDEWSQPPVTDHCAWVLKHGTRAQRKDALNRENAEDSKDSKG
ncbi:hypothetical protein [Corynebacterium cystitidis]|uniref:hypothetical protein n=1 Tax=Corynebacterium cystitidis TaxID=35757 RepID=UPI00211DA90D|nr:hypothetical protein [Corynebacterium cystitidis]